MRTKRFKTRLPIRVVSVPEKLPEAYCPRCGHFIDAATGLSTTGEPMHPKPGDLCLCAYCGSFNRYTDGLGVRRMTDEELRAIAPDSQLAALLEIAAVTTRRWREEHGGE